MKHLLRLIGLLFWSALAAAPLLAQSPCYLLARVSDAQTGEPLPGARFRLDSEGTAVLTDSTGQARVPLVCGRHGIGFEYLGYKSFFTRLVIAGETLLEVKMENIATQIEEVVVSSQSAVRTLETPALGVNLLSMKAVEKIVAAAGEVDVLRSLQTLPGISSVGEGANGINIRGGAVDQNMILLDNMPIFNPSHLLGLFSVFPTDAIREMQIYKGSIPARYGGRTAGVLDVKMSEPSFDKWTVKGGIGLISNRLHIEAPLVKDKLALMSSIRFSFNEYLIHFYNRALYGPVFEERLPNSKPQFYDFANKLVWRPTEKDQISLANYLSHDSYRVFNLYSIANIVPPEATIRYGHNNFALRWNHYFSDRWNLNTQIVRADYRTNTTASDLSAGFRFLTRLAQHSAKSELTFAPSSGQRINLGVSATRYDVRPADVEPAASSSLSRVYLAHEQAYETAFFISDEYEFSPRMLLEAGFRYVNYWNVGPLSVPVYAPDAPRSVESLRDTLYFGKNETESHYGRLEPRLALRYRINAHSSVKIGYNRMNQMLQMISNNSTPLPDVRWKTANRYVPPAQSDLISIGYFRDQPSRMWEWSAEAYFRWQRSIFDYLNGAALSIHPQVETQLIGGRARAYGAELLVNKKKGIMTGWLAYTYARSWQQVRGDFPALQQLNEGRWFRTNVDKPHTFNLIMNFQKEKHNALSFTFVYSTGRPYTAPVGFYQSGATVLPIYTDRNNGRISDYHRLDCSWTIYNPSTRQRRGEGSWVVSVYNVYGRKNAFSYFFDAERSSFKPFKVSVFPVPIFSLTFNFKFK